MVIAKNLKAANELTFKQVRKDFPEGSSTIMDEPYAVTADVKVMVTVRNLNSFDRQS